MHVLLMHELRVDLEIGPPNNRLLYLLPRRFCDRLSLLLVWLFICSRYVCFLPGIVHSPSIFCKEAAILPGAFHVNQTVKKTNIENTFHDPS